MTDNRNMILAIVLSALVLIGWGFISEAFFPAANPPPTKVEQGKSVAVPNPQADPTADSPRAIRDRGVVLRETPRVRIEAPSVTGSINLRGGRIDDLVLVEHHETLGPNAPPIRLLSPEGAAGAQLAGFGWTGEGAAVPNASTVWTASGTTLTPDRPVTLTWDNGQGQVFAIRYAIDADYLFTVDQSIANRSASTIAVRQYGFVSRTNVSADADTWTLHTGPIKVANGRANYDISFANLDGQQPGWWDSLWGTAAVAGVNEASSRGGWTGFTDKYWLTSVIPDQAGTVNLALRKGSEGRTYQADFLGEAAVVRPGAQLRQSARFFAGAKEVNLLDRYEAAGIPLFSNAIDWGWFEIVEKPMFKLLDFIFRLTGNFGVAIMGLTLVIRLLLYPIAQKQFASMAQMRAVQPQMKALQDRYKDDKPKLQQEMIELYKREKVNPFAGCLPIFIQIPIFYALYKILLLVVEMRHEPFVLWIKDLTAPDPLTPINLFGLLPFTPPSFIALGVLPILLGISMWAQFKLNPPPTDPVQAQVFGIMPWVFMVIMAPFAAGLQLYWLTNNILSIAQQKWLYSRHPQLRAVEAQAK